MCLLFLKMIPSLLFAAEYPPEYHELMKNKDFSEMDSKMVKCVDALHSKAYSISNQKNSPISAQERKELINVFVNQTTPSAVRQSIVNDIKQSSQKSRLSQALRKMEEFLDGIDEVSKGLDGLAGKLNNSVNRSDSQLPPAKVAKTASERPAHDNSTSKKVAKPPTNAANNDLGSMDEARKLALQGKRLADSEKNSEAEPILEQALNMMRRFQSEDTPEVIGLMEKLSAVCVSRSEYEKALPFVEKSLAFNRQHFGFDSAEALGNELNLLIIYSGTGDWKSALRIHRRVAQFTKTTVEEMRKALPASYPELWVFNVQLAAVQIQLALLAWKAGELGEAEMALRAFVRYIEDAGESAVEKSAGLVFLSSPIVSEICVEVDQIELAHNLYKRLSMLIGKKYGIKSEKYIVARGALASLNALKGDFDNAFPDLENWARLGERDLSKKRKTDDQKDDYAERLFSLACLYDRSGKWEEAESFFLRAIKIRADQRQTGSYVDDESNLQLSRIVSFYARIGRKQEALNYALQWINLMDKGVKSIRHLEERRRLAWQNENLRFDIPVSVLEPSALAALVFDWKGLTLETILEDRFVAARTADRTELDHLQILRQQLAVAMRRGDKESEITLLENKLVDVERNLAKSVNSDFSANEKRSETYEKICSKITAGTVFLNFITFNDLSPKYSKTETKIGVIIVQSDKKVDWIPLGGVSRLKELVSVFNNQTLGVSDDVLKNNLEELYKLYWSPIESTLPPETKSVLICPDGTLNFLPFAALIDSNGSFIAEKFNIAYVSNAKDLFRDVREISQSKNASIFVDPDFSAPLANGFANRDFEIGSLASLSGGKKVSSDTIRRLPATQREGAEISRLLESIGWDVKLRAGDQSSEASLRQTHSPTVLHLATHGFFQGGAVKREATAGSRAFVIIPKEVAGGASKASPISLFEEDWYPMRASGLLLAGAGTTFSAWERGKVPVPDNDGIFTAEEAAGLALDNTWLVTLSACQTGLGATRSGEGVFGLRRAFRIAGAQNLLMTLWPVGDETTASIMLDFYTKALSSGKAWESLAEVQRDWLVKLRKEKGLQVAVRDAGPFAMAVMVNPANSGLDGK